MFIPTWVLVIGLVWFFFPVILILISALIRFVWPIAIVGIVLFSITSFQSAYEGAQLRRGQIESQASVERRDKDEIKLLEMVGIGFFVVGILIWDKLRPRKRNNPNEALPMPNTDDAP